MQLGLYRVNRDFPNLVQLVGTIDILRKVGGFYKLAAMGDGTNYRMVVLRDSVQSEKRWEVPEIVRKFHTKHPLITESCFLQA